MREFTKSILNYFATYTETRFSFQKKADYKADAATFFMNIKSQRFIKRNPFSDVSLKRNSESMRTDFISKEDIDKLKDLSTVDYEDKTSVRDRLIAILAYDLALRINEFLALKMSDLHKDIDGTWSVTLRSESQKGHKVDDVTYFSFPETSEILERYLAIREKFCPKTDHLFVSKTGDALSQQHCRVRFKELCKKLNIMTYYGNVASPHCLRHSFATLNVEPLGLCMSLHDIAERLRHSRIETTRYHYVHNNPYIKKEKMKRYQKKSKKKTHMEILDETPLPELEHWLSDRVKVEPHIINIIRSKYKKAFVKPIDNAPKDVIYLSEVEALDRIKHLSISAYALRKYGLKKGICLVEGKGDIRYGRNFRYTESFIDDLANNWVPAKELVAKFKISRSDFYRRLKKNGWRKAKIGKACYIYKADCV
jgi:site-specific recombinase XerC